MAAFNRTAHILTSLAALTTSDINRITELRVSGGVHFDPMMEEIRDAARVALEPSGDRYGDLTGADVMADANIVETYDGDRLEQLARVQAAHDYDLSEMPDRTDATSSRLLDVIGYVLDEVYIQGAELLVTFLAEDADRAELAHDEDDEPTTDPRDWV